MRCNLHIMLGCRAACVAEPLLQFKESHWFLRVEELRSDGGARAMCSNVAANIGKRHACLGAERGDKGIIEIGLSYLSRA
jgi:hypothetical protein